MKKTILFLTICLLLVGCEKEAIVEKKTLVRKQTTDLQRLNLQASVKSIEEFTFGVKYIDGNFFKGDLEYRKIILFDISGYILEESHYTQNGDFIRSTGFNYDSAGNIIRITNKTSLGWDDYIHKYSYGIQENHFIINSFYEDGTIYSQVIETYDNSGNLINSKYKDFYYEEESETEFDYDNNNYLIEIRRYIMGEACKSYLKFKNDYKGRRIEQREYYTEYGLSQLEAYAYDSLDNRIKEYYYSNTGDLFHRRDYTYNYDSIGNWTQEVFLFFNEARNIYDRVIAYY